MGYIEKTLVGDEKIEKHFKLHWIVYVKHILFFWLFFPIIWFVQALFIEYALTTKRVVTKEGIISRDSEEMRLVKVETVEVKQGIIGRILGYGNVHISGTGSSNFIFSTVSNPIEVKKSIDAQLS
ncbi:PH domain-containing protein [Flavobacteriaceae bacterium]|nr:PH domain-containing protein [Flavobacteriaceae bacterium]